MRHVLADWYRVAVWVILAVAAMVRLNGLFLKAEGDWVQTDVGRDMLIGRHIAQNWDGWLATPYSSWAIMPSSPLHYWLVAGTYTLTGSVYGVYFVYAGLSLIVVWMFALVGQEIAGKFAGLFFALVAALSPLLVGYASLLSQISLLPVLSSLVLLGLIRYARQTKPGWLWLVTCALVPMALLHNSGILFALLVIVVSFWLALIMKRLVQDGWLLLAMTGLVAAALYWGVIYVNGVSLVQLMSQIWSELQTVTLSTRENGFAQVISGLNEGIYPGGLLVVGCFGVVSLFWRWRTVQKQRLALLMTMLVGSVVLVGLAPIQSLGSLREHYLGPWLVMLIVMSWGWPWLLPPGWGARLSKVVMVGVFGWWVLTTGSFSFHMPDVRISAAPQSLTQLLWADAVQSGFDQEGFEIWSVIWEQDAVVITDWYAGGWWDNLEQIADRQLVSVVPVSQKQNNIRVKAIGGGVYLICPDNPVVSEWESKDLQGQFGVPVSVIGRQRLSRPTAECLDVFWRGGDDAEPKSKTWILGRVIAPGSKTGGYALIKYHN